MVQAQADSNPTTTGVKDALSICFDMERDIRGAIGLLETLAMACDSPSVNKNALSVTTDHALECVEAVHEKWERLLDLLQPKRDAEAA
jgi:hypothetical protein